MMKRRSLLLCTVVPVFAADTVRAAPADPRDKAYEARTLAEAQRLLGLQKPEPGLAVRLTVPDIVDVSPAGGGRATVQVSSQIPGTDWIAVFVTPAERPLLVFRDIAPGAERSLATVLRMKKTVDVLAVVRAGGRYYQVSREIKAARKPGQEAQP